MKILSHYTSEDEYWSDLLAYANDLCINALIHKGYNMTDIPLSCNNTLSKKILNMSEILQKSKASKEINIFLALPYLLDCFVCDSLETDIILLALLPEIDKSYQKIYLMLSDGESSHCTLQIVYDVLQIDFTKRHVILQHIHMESKLGLFFLKSFTEVSEPERLLVLNKSVIHFVLNRMYNTEYATWYLQIYKPNEENIILHDVQKIDTQFEKSDLPVLWNIYGKEGTGRKSNIKQYANINGCEIHFMNMQTFMEDGQDKWKEIVWNCLVFDGILCLETNQQDPCDAQEFHRRISHILSYCHEIFVVSTKPLELTKMEETIRYVFIDMPYDYRKYSNTLWQSIGLDRKIDSQVLEELAGKYVFTPGKMKEAIQYAKNGSREELLKSCKLCVQHKLGDKAEKVERLYSFEDLILPQHSKQLIQMACDQVRYRSRIYEEWGFNRKIAYGTGTAMVFAGPPGTGKTMAAQVVADILSMDLYRVDLTSIVSKYVGETEKNLKEIFIEAQKSMSILFFDEADVIFSKRTEMKEAQDKYNNMEAAFLLQKMEEYQGISILATNFLQNFDEAFKRRMKFIIDFPLPNISSREQLWNSVFPTEMPIEEALDYKYLASAFELTGSEIKNVAVSAAFIAASQQERVKMKHILTAIKNEYMKLGKMLNKADFGEYYYLL
ncbi:MAG: ATP-binding protein [Lachnospiraceae bacterium]